MVTVSSALFKIESGDFTFTPQKVPVFTILNQVVKAHQALFKSKNITLSAILQPKPGEPPHAIGEGALYFSIFNNLIKNAFEATPDGGLITISFLIESPLRLSITNQGAVPAEIRERFFEKYVTHGKEGGTGMGTYSAKRLMEALHGSIEMSTSEADNTTTLLLTFPQDP